MFMKIKSAFKIFCFSALFVILCYIEGKFNFLSKNSERSTMGEAKIHAVDFEVFGIVQGVFFRKHTEEAANKFNVRGWCMNTRDGTVKGQIEGEEKNVNLMKDWLSNKGSPQSRIDKTVFSNPKQLTQYSFEKFEIRRVPKN